jgi:starch synthase
VVGMISRLVSQKGFDLLSSAIDELPRLDAVFVLLGVGDPGYEEQWRSLARRYPRQFGARLAMDEDLAHLIEAGADIFLMPSRFEPCGLNQMYSLRYGTVPVVRATGGLDDTVRQYDATDGSGWGFKFEEASAGAMLSALRAALDAYKDKETWRSLQAAGMGQDFSWDRSARDYVAVYERAMAAAPRGGP